MGEQRLQRVAEEIKKEIGKIIQEEIKDPRVGFITITKVDLSRDLRLAKVYFSLLGTKKQLRDTQIGLKRSSGFVRKLLGEKMKLRYTPQLVFKLDKNIEYSIHISEVLERIRDKDERKASSQDNKKVF